MQKRLGTAMMMMGMCMTMGMCMSSRVLLQTL